MVLTDTKQFNFDIQSFSFDTPVRMAFNAPAGSPTSSPGVTQVEGTVIQKVILTPGRYLITRYSYGPVATLIADIDRDCELYQIVGGNIRLSQATYQVRAFGQTVTFYLGLDGNSFVNVSIPFTNTAVSSNQVALFDTYFNFSYGIIRFLDTPTKAYWLRTSGASGYNQQSTTHMFTTIQRTT